MILFAGGRSLIIKFYSKLCLISFKWSISFKITCSDHVTSLNTDNEASCGHARSMQEMTRNCYSTYIYIDIYSYYTGCKYMARQFTGNSSHFNYNK